MRRFFKLLISAVCIIIMLGVSFAALVFYGPFTNLRALYVTSAMTSMNHQWLATAFISQKEINRIMNANKTISSPQNTDANKITGTDNGKVTEGSDDIQYVDISNGEYKGYMLIVNNPAKVSIGTTKQLGKKGMTVEDIVNAYGAIAGVNAGGFADKDGNGTGGTPLGILIQDGKVLYRDKSKIYSIIGMDKHNVLVLGRYTFKQIQNMGIRDAVTFQPFLIVNGVPAITKGDGGWGLAPRTAIGQTKDGRILLLVIDGRQISSIGASMKDIIDIMQRFGAYNAANLDGGASSTMVYRGKVINHPYSYYGSRDVPSAFIIK